MKVKALSVSLWTILSAAVLTAAPVPAGKDYARKPVPFTEVKLTDAFWAPKIETNRTTTIPFIFGKCEETGRIDHFAIAGGLMKGTYKGERYNDTDIYKTLEGASYSLAVHPDPKLDAYCDSLIVKIKAAQEPDGYLFTARTVDPLHPQPGIGPERWSELAVSHELYNAGHLYEAAVAHFQATGKRTLLDIAIKNADLVVSVFGPDKRHGFPGHQVIEMGLAKLYRTTGDVRYLDLAKYFLDQRGRDVKLTIYPPRSRFAIYNDPVQIQAHKPVLEQDEAVGHAVRASYLFSGMADVAALTGNEDYVRAVDRLWDNVVSRKLALTGGLGARHARESFGAAYELPNLTSYNETCASIGNAYWNLRMFLLHGDAKYLDVMERVIYNGLISGVSLDGKAFFYPNPLEADGKYKFNQGDLTRAPWFGVACCPGNIARFIPSFPGYVYATDDTALYVNLFVANTASVTIGGKTVAVRQETRYPWDGAVKIAVDPEKASEFTVAVRIPGWAQGRPVPGTLYRYADAAAGPGVKLSVNGEPLAVAPDKGFVRISRAWKKGDAIELFLPMPVRRVIADPAVKDDAGKIALERGPLVYCAEGIDNGGTALDLMIPAAAEFTTEFRPDFLNGVVVIKGAASSGDRKRELLAIPYYAWSNRGVGEMAVWMKSIE
ncbi:MAG: glycoside hydrolase family 127 protein [Candidatus Aminicenantales bacterium]